MKIIEGLKQVKELHRKADDIKKKISDHSAYLSYETPVYKDQTKQVKEWLQSYSDILKEILRLRIAIQRTNLETLVTITIGETAVTKPIAAWIIRRRELADLEASVWNALTDKGLKEMQVKQSTGEIMPVTIVRCFSPELRDKQRDLFMQEPSIIDARLEVTNAVTDLIE